MPVRPVNARQLDVLTWIVKGCPPRDWPDSTHKTVAVALQGRRLATVSRKGGAWRAEATDGGRYFVEHGAYPDGHWSTHSGRSSSAAARAARPDSLPAGRSIDRQGVAKRRTTASPKAQPAAKPATPPPIRVAARMSSRPHPAVKAIQAHPNALSKLSKMLRPRALRILDALAKEAVRRGYEITEREGRLRVSVRGHGTTLDFREPTTRVEHVPTKAELASQAKYSWSRPPKWDYLPSGRLRAVVGHSDVAEPKPRKDGTMAWVIEDRLDRVLTLVEAAAETAEYWERRRRDEAEAKQRRWEQVRAQAQVEFHEHRRVEVLQDQVQRWEETSRLAGFLEALDAHIATLTTSEDTAAAIEWREWVTSYVASRAPFSEPVRMPPKVEPGPQDLAPFMRGLSPYGA